jgi:hypothetical protein
MHIWSGSVLESSFQPANPKGLYIPGHGSYIISACSTQPNFTPLDHCFNSQNYWKLKDGTTSGQFSLHIKVEDTNIGHLEYSMTNSSMGASQWSPSSPASLPQRVSKFGHLLRESNEGNVVFVARHNSNEVRQLYASKTILALSSDYFAASKYPTISC